MITAGGLNPRVFRFPQLKKPRSLINHEFKVLRISSNPDKFQAGVYIFTLIPPPPPLLIAFLTSSRFIFLKKKESKLSRFPIFHFSTNHQISSLHYFIVCYPNRLMKRKENLKEQRSKIT